MTNFCPICIKENHHVDLELTESMLLICTRCSHAFAVRSNGHREIYQEGFRV